LLIRDGWDVFYVGVTFALQVVTVVSGGVHLVT